MQPGRPHAACEPCHCVRVRERSLTWLQLHRALPVAPLQRVPCGNSRQPEISSGGTCCTAHHHLRIEARRYLRQGLEDLARGRVLRRLQIGIHLVIARVKLLCRLALATRSPRGGPCSGARILPPAHPRERWSRRTPRSPSAAPAPCTPPAR